MPPARTDAPPPPSSVYRELRPSSALEDLLACRWYQQVADDRVQRVVPDGCADVVWIAGRELVVAGPATHAALASLPAGSATVGVRFRPGTGAAALGVPLDALRDVTIPLAEVWGAERADRLADALAAEAGAAAGATLAQLDRLERAVLAARADAPPVDRLVLAAAQRFAGAPASVRVRDVGDALGVSERQLLRRFRAAVGYGPKTLARVLRFQRFLQSAWEMPAPGSGPGLSRLAFDAGYADQAHLARECRDLAGVSPRRLLAGS
ncbi:AraC family transcriptional regulator [Conexibacter woesei]|uniref:Helix-turn-helix, AraC domain protein n=1 Tax=Conexibacter woesei (strain DSM 14684 / CCUG 47730 / CIP 108061 / JCM 11494 / NBRC 100937 / ID131577) TaxID=469383 RepID=D3F8W0_CONWI|nr:helix-turn-helix domain-containing protein [Conexibacter woesei]ADB52955.1 Helix-turn-helix, AraC domain protein [Conexibacter woesei DSM 14684]